MRIIPLAVVVFLASTAPAHAYSDPGSGLLMLQMLGSALVGMLFYVKKIKRWLSTRFGGSKHDSE